MLIIAIDSEIVTVIIISNYRDFLYMISKKYKDISIPELPLDKKKEIIKDIYSIEMPISYN